MRLQLLLCLMVCAFAKTSVQAQVEAPVGSAAFAGPVELMGYAGGIAVEWRSGQPSQVDYYAVERIVDGVERVVATFTPQLGSDSTAKYRYIDQGDYVVGLSFRVRAAYLDGSYAESEDLSASAAHGRRTRMLSALDDESLARLHIRLDSDSRQQVVVEVSTLAGAAVASFQRELLTGRNDLEIDYTGWPEGYYNIGFTDTASERHEWLVHVDPSTPLARTRRLPGNS